MTTEIDHFTLNVDVAHQINEELYAYVPNYSTDVREAFKAVTKITDYHLSLFYSCVIKEWCATFMSSNPVGYKHTKLQTHENPATAICLAIVDIPNAIVNWNIDRAPE
jgi:hypothetical protein